MEVTADGREALWWATEINCDPVAALRRKIDKPFGVGQLDTVRGAG